MDEIAKFFKEQIDAAANLTLIEDVCDDQGFAFLVAINDHNDKEQEANLNEDCIYREIKLEGEE